MADRIHSETCRRALLEAYGGMSLEIIAKHPTSPGSPFARMLAATQLLARMLEPAGGHLMTIQAGDIISLNKPGDVVVSQNRCVTIGSEFGAWANQVLAWFIDQQQAVFPSNNLTIAMAVLMTADAGVQLNPNLSFEYADPRTLTVRREPSGVATQVDVARMLRSVTASELVTLACEERRKLSAADEIIPPADPREVERLGEALALLERR